MQYFFFITSILLASHSNASTIDIKEFPYIKPISVERVEINQIDKRVGIAKDQNTVENENALSNTDSNTSKYPQRSILNISFASSKANILPETLGEIEELAQFLQENKTYEVIIYGYTDNTSKKSNNQKLSQNRAKAVMKALIAYGIKLTRLTAIGMGSKNPIAENNTAQGRAKNRRIEVELLQ